MRNAFISEHPLLLRPSLHIEEDNIVVIEEMQAHLSELNLNHRPYGSWHLFLVVKFAEYLELQALSLTEVTQNYRDAVGLRKALEKSLLLHCQVPLALIKVRIVRRNRHNDVLVGCPWRILHHHLIVGIFIFQEIWSRNLRVIVATC